MRVEPFEKESLESLENLLEETWERLLRKGIDREMLLARSLISPATCCLVNPDIEKTVESAFAFTRRLSAHLREKYSLA